MRPSVATGSYGNVDNSAAAAIVTTGVGGVTVQRSVRATGGPLGGCYDVPLLPFPMPSPIPHTHLQQSSQRSVDHGHYHDNYQHGSSSSSSSRGRGGESLAHTSWPLGPANRAFLSSSQIMAPITPSYHIGDNRRYASTVTLPISAHSPPPPHHHHHVTPNNNNNNGSQSARPSRGLQSSNGELTFQHFTAMMAARDAQYHNNNNNNNGSVSNSNSSVRSGSLMSRSNVTAPRVGDIGWGVDLAHTMIKDYGHGHIQGLHGRYPLHLIRTHIHSLYPFFSFPFLQLSASIPSQLLVIPIERQVVTDIHHSFTHLKGHPSKTFINTDKFIIH
jgi:hypothetical protein